MAEQTKTALAGCTNEREPSNSFYCPHIVDILIKRFFPIYPLWSGLLLGSLRRYECSSKSLSTETNETRDSNAYVEAWFRIVKKDIFRGKERLRPATFVSKLKRSINARMKEVNLSGLRNTKKKRRGIDVAEEKWSKKKRHRKNRYQPQKKTKEPSNNSANSVHGQTQHKVTPATATPLHENQDVCTPVMKAGDQTIGRKNKASRKTKKSNRCNRSEKPTAQSPQESRTICQKYPSVPRWGVVTSSGQYLQNTCTIDNFLTIMHITLSENASLFTDCDRQNAAMNTLLNCLHLMSTGNFADAKAAWLTMVKEQCLRKKVINLYGDEYEMFAGIFNRSVQTMTKEKCSSPTCPHPYIERRRTGIFLSSDCPSTIDEMFREWIDPGDSICGLTMSSDSDVESVTGETDEMRCTGGRSVSRRFGDQKPSLLVLQVADLVCIGYLQNDVESFSESLAWPTGDVYKLVGVTMHRSGHFSACIRSTLQGWQYYDGLVGSMKTYSRNCVAGCTPVNVIYVHGLK